MDSALNIIYAVGGAFGITTTGIALCRQFIWLPLKTWSRHQDEALKGIQNALQAISEDMAEIRGKVGLEIHHHGAIWDRGSEKNGAA